jgi:beta-N-acetylhexosaminidase
VKHSIQRAAVALALALPLGLSAQALQPNLPENGGLPPLEAMIGQMLIVGFEGVKPGEPGVQRAVRQLAQGRIGGVILMDRNIRSPKQVRELTAVFAGAKPSQPALIAVDQEGGRVQRLSSRKGFRSYPAAKRIANSHGPLAAYFVYRRMAEELAEAGFNLNFGPVVDLNLNARNHVINGRGRSYGADPAQVTAYATAFVAAHRHAGVLTSLKHFPGHGSSPTDSHAKLVDITKSWSERELGPYRALAALHAIDTVMVGHLYHPEFSETGLPATLAPNAVAWLREDLAFDGVVITDDLGMGAVRKKHSLEEALVLAVNAGNDLLLMSNHAKGEDAAARAIGAIRAAVEDGRIPASRIADAWRRVTALKETLTGPESLRQTRAAGHR